MSGRRTLARRADINGADEDARLGADINGADEDARLGADINGADGLLTGIVGDSLGKF
jgi:hypothetical protein